MYHDNEVECKKTFGTNNNTNMRKAGWGKGTLP